jgi:hypothetical protein
MSPQPVNDDIEGPDDVELRHLLRRCPPPPPSPGFVEDTLLRLSLAALSTPPASQGFVDRVLTKVAADRRPGPSARPFRGRLSALRLAGALLVAAAVVVAVLPLGRGPGSDLPPPWPSPLDPAGYPAQGVLPVGRSVSLIRASLPATAVAGDGVTPEERRPIPGWYFPPPPPILVEAGLLAEREPWSQR